MATIEVMPARLTREETEDLRRAVACLEGASFAQRLTDAIGRPVGILEPRHAATGAPRRSRMRARPRCAARSSSRCAPSILKRAAKPANRAHKLAAAASGAVGGALGLAALPVELPISTTILLRSIAEIAREEGEDLSAPGRRLRLRRSVRARRPRRRGGGVRERIFRRPRRARQIGHRQRALCRRRGRRRPFRAGRSRG